MKPFLASHDPSWKESFSRESRELVQALGQSVIAIHHVGSTSIPGVFAKPVIDVLVEVKKINHVDENVGRMRNLFYESLGEHGIAGRRYFRRPGTDDHPAFHVHVFEASSEQVMRHLVFRDYLRAHAGKALEYSKLKVRISSTGLASKSDYQKAKTPFIEACIKDVTKWSNQSR